MVWTRTKLMIWDYLLEPLKVIQFDYAGKAPEKLYKKINELIRIVFDVPDAYVQEKDYNWEKEGNTEKFAVGWEVHKVLDLYSYLEYEIVLKGFTTDGAGRARIRLRARLITEYPQDTLLQNNIIYEMLRRMWHRIFYHNRRMEFLRIGKELTINFENKLKQYLEYLREGKAE